jgi:CheY-like chemotaxis protein/anti-sigma regulatory factor (Ser/Thr protein kinase)
LLYLVEDILDISKIESGTLVVESVSTNVERLLAEVASTATIQAVDRGIELYVSPLPDLSLRDIYTDPFRLKQVLSNLLSNAIKFTHTGHVSLTATIVNSGAGMRTVRFTVEDTGIGIPEDKQGNLFSAFTQVDMSTTRRYGGTGLGLFICSGIVKLMQGTIELESREGCGTRIDVVLPFTVSGNSEARPPSMENGTFGRIRYSDSYEPLSHENERLISSAFVNLYNGNSDKLPGTVYINHVPNRLLSNSWRKPEHLANPSFDANDPDVAANLAWISQITPMLEKNLKQAGYTGYVLKTPSLIQLKRNIQFAMSGQCFVAHSGGPRLDDRPDKASRSLTVLAVDDQSINIELLMQYFDYLDIRGIYASSGAEALAYLVDESIDLVLLDLHMPDLDGFEVAEKIRASGSANAQVPIIAMTADAYQTTRDKALSAGFDDLLTKPATVQQVSETIRSWVKSEAVLPCTTLVDIKACAAAVRANEEWAKNALKTYGLEIPGHVQGIRHALREKDQSAMFEVAHSVKGVSRILQINQVANAAEALEKVCSESNWVQIAAEAHELERLLHLAEDECNTIPV